MKTGILKSVTEGKAFEGPWVSMVRETEQCDSRQVPQEPQNLRLQEMEKKGPQT